MGNLTEWVNLKIYESISIYDTNKKTIKVTKPERLSYRRMEHVNSVFSFAPSLLVAKNEVNPLIQMLGDVI